MLNAKFVSADNVQEVDMVFEGDLPSLECGVYRLKMPRKVGVRSIEGQVDLENLLGATYSGLEKYLCGRTPEAPR